MRKILQIPTVIMRVVIKTIFFSAFFVLVCATGCNEKPGESAIVVDKERLSKIYTESELNKLIAPGMSITEITNKFGAPGTTIKIGSDAFMLTYMFPFGVNREQGLHLTGFEIDVKNGRVTRWSPITGRTGKTVKAGGAQSAFGEQTFQAFIAKDSLTNAVAIVDSTGSADASDFKSPPDLSFKAKMFAGSSDEHPGEQKVILVLSEDDKLKLKALTEENFGQRLLIVCRNKAIAAPVIPRRLTLEN